MEENPYIKGRGAQFKSANRFERLQRVTEHEEGIDEDVSHESVRTMVFYEHPKKIINATDSPDMPQMYSINPYQGCEHGCIYCYARPTHEYWGFSAGLDFESKIVVKANAPQVLEASLLARNWKGEPVTLSGNTDCYQPLERKLEITRKLLLILQKYRNPVGIITKNALVTRDIDILKEMAQDGLAHVYLSVTTLDESLRQVLEPRTATSTMRLQTIQRLTEAGIPTGVMIAPIIPGLTDHEIPKIMQKVAEAGALTAGYTVVRLNGANGELFKDWVSKNFPNRAEKIWNQIAEIHGGEVSDSQFGRRMRGEGPIAEAINQLFKKAKSKYMHGREMPPYAQNTFRKGGNYSLF
ncbi:PA0069 family radical SAM protein [Cytophagales bacterium LB-30]|uniref:PA0069 family radical SAM protein n=1 Tax=Shiella aurantiaca TaxID=3058365 RepID=A0ABT8F713_9BACT|nr:PA0069 family radical SAM protein [Shiella aurantiaca]MDN4166159.1 PA0069 family radical SAM protein [Shiella aurantiaca]